MFDRSRMHNRGLMWVHMRALALAIGVLVVPERAAAALRPVPQVVRPDSTCLAVSDSAREFANDTAFKNRSMRCALVADSTRRFRATRLAVAAVQEAITIPFTIPESGDEQRLDDGMGTLGPTAFIYPSPGADGFTHRGQIAAHGAPGLFVAIVVVDPPDGGGPMPSTYTNLGLKQGINCIWLRASSPDPALPYQVWVSDPWTTGACDRTHTTGLRGPLFVDERRVPNGVGYFRHADYPPAPRFGINGTQPLLGFKCLDAWCEAGPGPFAQHAPWVAVAGREGRIKGWHDEQRLAERDHSGVWRPTIRATIVPVPNLDQLDKADFSKTTGSGRPIWVNVASIHLLDDPSGTKYYTWGLRRGRNLAELHFDGSAWHMRISPQGAPQVIWNVAEMPHEDVAVPGSVRFRFTVADDGFWVPCGQSCCRAGGL